jgi:hypothetical protein
MSEVVWTGYGAAAYEALRTMVTELKRKDPLAPVTVLVPTDLCGVVARQARSARPCCSCRRSFPGRLLRYSPSWHRAAAFV